MCPGRNSVLDHNLKSTREAASERSVTRPERRRQLRVSVTSTHCTRHRVPYSADQQPKLASCRSLHRTRPDTIFCADCSPSWLQADASGLPSSSCLLPAISMYASYAKCIAVHDLAAPRGQENNNGITLWEHVSPITVPRCPQHPSEGWVMTNHKRNGRVLPS